MKLQEFISTHASRGECQCGKCCDKGADRQAPKHSANVHFFWVAAAGEPDRDEFIRLIESEYPHVERLKDGPSYIEIGGDLGSQGLGLMFMGLGELLRLWKVIRPEHLGFKGEEAAEMAGMGLVMISGFDNKR